VTRRSRSGSGYWATWVRWSSCLLARSMTGSAVASASVVGACPPHDPCGYAATGADPTSCRSAARGLGYSIPTGCTGW
jgi:hypothetical protein